MRHLTPEEIVSLEAFVSMRPAFREAVIAHKRKRRVAVGDRVTLLFEDRETIRWQVQEMCRVENIRDRAAIQHELDVYNELLPGDGELSATLFVEIPEKSAIRPELDRLIGIDEHVALLVGEDLVRADFDPKQMESDRISAVQYVRFRLSPGQGERLGDASVPLRIRIDHPNYVHETVLSEAQRSALAADLRGDPPAFLGVASAGRPVAPGPQVLRQRGRVRAVRPAAPCAPGHVVVEAMDPDASFTQAESSLLAEVLALAQELSREVLTAHGTCRVSLDASATPLRCDVFAPGRDAH